MFLERTQNNTLPVPTLAALANSSSEIQLDWTLPLSPPAGDLSLVIERCQGEDGIWNEVISLPAEANTAVDGGLESEWYYYYRVATINAAGERSAWSNEASALTNVEAPRYTVIDLGASLRDSLVALQLLQPRDLYAQVNSAFPPASVIDLEDATVLSIGENGDILLEKNVSAANGTSVDYYLLWHLDGRPTDRIAEPRFKAVNIGRDGSVLGAKDFSDPPVTTEQRNGIYQGGRSLWPYLGTLPGNTEDSAGSPAQLVDVRAMKWTKAGGLQEITAAPDRFALDNFFSLDLSRPVRPRPKSYDTIQTAWDSSADGTVVGGGTWQDLRNLPGSFDFLAQSSYEDFSFQHALRWKNGWWDVVGSLELASKVEGILTATNTLGTVSVGISARSVVGGIVPSHGIRTRLGFGEAMSRSRTGDADLEDLLPLPGGSLYSGAGDVDDSGNAVGYSYLRASDPMYRTQAVWWELQSPPTGEPFQLPNLEGTDANYPNGYGYARSIDRLGTRIVGQSLAEYQIPNPTNPDGPAEKYVQPAAVLWLKNAGQQTASTSQPAWEVVDLNQQINQSETDIWALGTATDINQNGIIVGMGIHDGEKKAFLLVPVDFKISKPSPLEAFSVCDAIPLRTKYKGWGFNRIQKVEYYYRNSKIGESMQGPDWHAVWQNLPAGEWKARTIEDRANGREINPDCFVLSILAKATLDNGLVIESLPQKIRVLPISRSVVEFIKSVEIDEDLIGRNARPEWPGASSGVTIGVGYDLGMNTKEQIRSDWEAFLTKSVLDRLVSLAGITGSKAKQRLLSVNDIEIPWSAINAVYENQTIPRFTSDTLGIYPQASSLNPNITGTLVSLVFNRGASLTDRKGQRPRYHMRDIQAALRNGQPQNIPSILRDMSDLWAKEKISKGMRNRREAEAKFIEKALIDTDNNPCN